MVAKINQEDDSGSWINEFEETHGASHIYLTSFYFIVTTFTTVGYGDIGIGSSSEKIFCIFFMVMGIVSFSLATGTLTSIIKTYDSQNFVLKEKNSILDKISKEYSFPP